MNKFIINLILLIGVSIAITFQSKTQIHVNSLNNAGIGTETPDYKLDVTGSGYIQSVFQSTNSSGGIMLKNYTGRKWEIQCVNSSSWTCPNGLIIYDRSAGSYRFVILSNGYAGIGTRNPQYKLDVAGYIRATNVTVPSDYRFKNNIKDLKPDTFKITNLRPVQYNYTKDLFDIDISDSIALSDSMFVANQRSEEQIKILNKKHYGFIAQEVQQIFPELVDEDKNGILSIDYISLIPIIVSDLKQQERKYEELQAKYQELINQISVLQTSLK